MTMTHLGLREVDTRTIHCAGRTMVRALFALLLLVPLYGAAAQPAPAATTPERRAAAAALVEALGVAAQVDTMLTGLRGNIIAGLRRQSPSMSERDVASLVDEFLMPEFRARSAEISAFTADQWAQRLTVEEIRELAVFYATPLGRKILAVTPEIGIAGVQFGQAWGERVGRDAVAKHGAALRARGLNL